jgi:tetratricopeptide (TPR) repeat protein
MGDMVDGYTDLIKQAENALLNEQWAEALGKFDLALVALNEAGQTLPDSEMAEIYNGRGAALLQTGVPQQAIDTLNHALKLNPQMAIAYFNRGLGHEALDQTAKALEDYAKAIELEPNDAEFYFKRSATYFMLEQFDKTIEDTTRAIELHPDAPVIGPLVGRGLAYHRLDKIDLAEKDYTRAIEADPRAAADAYFYRALVHLDNEDALSARADLQAFLLMTAEPDGLLGLQAKEIIEELDKL